MKKLIFNIFVMLTLGIFGSGICNGTTQGATVDNAVESNDDEDDIESHYVRRNFDLSEVTTSLSGEIDPSHVEADITQLLDSLKHLPFFHEELEADAIAKMKDYAHQLQRYNDGKRKYFPAGEVSQVLKPYLHEYSRWGNHSGTGTDYQSLMIVPLLLDHTARLCQDINWMADVCAADHHIGAINIDSEYDYYSKYCFLVYRTNQNHRMLYLPNNLYEIKIIRKLPKEKLMGDYKYGDWYILTTEEGLLNDAMILAGIFPDGGATVVDLAADKHYIKWQNARYDLGEDVVIYYNPIEISWTYCFTNKFGNLQRIDGSPKIYLTMDDGLGFKYEK